jgi:ankyrin repeat protein
MSPSQQLIDAAKSGDVAATRDAIRGGANPNSVDASGWAPLMWAAQEGHTEVVDQLLTAGADPNFTDDNGFTPLKQALSDQHIQAAEKLILAGADVNQRCSSDGNSTPLHTAAAYGLLDSIELLCQYGANARARDDDGKTPYDVAVVCDEGDAADKLRSPGMA